MPAIIFVTVWRFAPYFMVVFLAGLLAIPDDYYEAARSTAPTPYAASGTSPCRCWRR